MGSGHLLETHIAHLSLYFLLYCILVGKGGRSISGHQHRHRHQAGHSQRWCSSMKVVLDEGGSALVVGVGGWSQFPGCAEGPDGCEIA